MKTDGEILRRWCIGHHAFFVLIQGIVLAHRTAQNGLKQKSYDRVRKALARSERLLRGAACSMKLAADMSTDQYEQVRKTMQPPNVPEGFSGLWSSDHRVLISELRNFRPLITGNQEFIEPEYSSWVKAVDTIYKEHYMVCEQFVGDGPSLAIKPKNVTSSGPESLRYFRRQALLSISPEVEAISPKVEE